ncbi:MAG: CDP-alcohol phosphatidyltransferase family protein [candidate division KSB1 bacterium]|nr:CDP-alcohol phosphatidyltransferase family protein [candidate division KSB1 bacterium]
MSTPQNSIERQRIWTLSNFISFTRPLFVLPALWFLHLETPAGTRLAVLFMLGAVFTDWADGFLARRLHQQSELGRIIDPVMDKLCVAIVGFYLAFFRDFPKWFLVLIIARDLFILVLGFLMTSRRHRVPESNWYGKVAVTALAIVMITFTLDLQPIKWPFFWIMVVLFLISAGIYIARFISDTTSAARPVR